MKANERFMDLARYPYLPRELRCERLRQDEWQPLKNTIHKESGGICFYCGQLTDRPICDHKRPISRGGTNDPPNLATACHACNASKGMLTDEEFFRKREAS